MTNAAKKLVQPGLFGGEPEPYEAARAIPFQRPADNMPAGKLVQVAPGKWAMKNGPDPEYILAEVFRHPDGTLGLRPADEGRCVRLTWQVGEMLGFPGQLHTVRRLARAGFVRMPQPSPGVHLLDLDSWYKHLHETEAEPEFWDPEGDNLRRYLMANGLRVG